MNEPTDEGKRRYPTDGMYEGQPCTCTADCQYGCKGECGCEACHYAYGDFLTYE